MEVSESRPFLLRSFSQPSETTLQPNEVDPLRALGESISFGRYMSESLEWEKRSMFVRNKYLEEAENYAKPGSVAKMKAYFEAHYKRFAAKKKPPVVVKRQTEWGPNSVKQTEVAVVEQSSKGTHGDNEGGNSTVEQLRKGVDDNNEVEAAADEISSKGANGVDGTDGVAVEEVSEGDFHEVEVREAARSSCLDTEPVEDRSLPAVELLGKEVSNSNVGSCDPASLLKVGQNDVEDRESGVAEIPVECSGGVEVVQSKDEKDEPIVGNLEKVSVQNTVDLEKSDCKQISGSSSSKRSACRKISKISSSIARLATPLLHRKEESVSTPPTKRNTLFNKKSPTSRVVPNLCIHPNADVTKKPPTVQKTQSGSAFTPCVKIMRESSAVSQTPHRASVRAVSGHMFATPRMEPRRTMLGDTAGGSRSAAEQLQSPSLMNNKSPARKTQTPLKLSPFTFRTEERAAKRKEFFQKLQEKKEEEMEVLNKTKKPKTIPTKVLSSRSVKAREMGDRKTEPSSSNLKKILWPKTPSQNPQETCSQPPRRPSANAKLAKQDAEENHPRGIQSRISTLKRTYGNTQWRPASTNLARQVDTNNPRGIQSSTSQLKKNTHEYSSSLKKTHEKTSSLMDNTHENSSPLMKNSHENTSPNILEGQQDKLLNSKEVDLQHCLGSLRRNMILEQRT